VASIEPPETIVERLEREFSAFSRLLRRSWALALLVAAALGLYGWWKLGEFPTRKPTEEKSGPALTAEISAAQAILRTAETYRSLIDENKRLSDQLDRYKASEQREEVRKLQTQLSDVQSRLQTANRMLISARGNLRSIRLPPFQHLGVVQRQSTQIQRA
jgi:hypothetical protein